MVEVEVFQYNILGENTILLIDESRNCVVIDPGMQSENEKRSFDDHLSQRSLTLKSILLTHLHIDHVYGVGHLQQCYSVPVYGPKSEQEYLFLNEQLSDVWGLPVQDSFEINVDTHDGDTISISTMRFDVLTVPGHSVGGTLYYMSEEGILISGDVLFRGSIGRSDFPGGSERQLLEGIRRKVLTLPEATIVYPGHGATTTIGDERRHLAFFA
ncbi:MAG: MBL fold metallo-hydrolase [Marinilabiliaceae bacterium]|nr:MBL fold metallo-hydrolase [Marinilabiliaceae bacterium]